MTCAVPVDLCVCVRERERKRARGRWVIVCVEGRGVEEEEFVLPFGSLKY